MSGQLLTHKFYFLKKIRPCMSAFADCCQSQQYAFRLRELCLIKKMQSQVQIEGACNDSCNLIRNSMKLLYVCV